jgi:nitrogen regulatory protein PII 1
MKMIRAVVRPEKEDAVQAALTKAGFAAMTRWDVLGRGKQSGVQVGKAVYEELAKSMFMVVVEDDRLSYAIAAIRQSAFTGNPGDGKIIVSDVDSAYTIRTGTPDL